MAMCPSSHAIAQQTSITCQTSEAFLERRTGSEGVLYQVERAAGQRLSQMDAESVVASESRGDSPRLLGQGLGNANIGILEPRSPEKSVNRRGIDMTALEQCDEVRQY